MKELKKISLKSILPGMIILFGATAVFAGLIIYSLFTKATTTPLTLDMLDYSTDLDGVYVKDTVYGIYDYYCETTSDSRVMSREYIIDAGSEHFIGLLAKDTTRKKADELMDASWDYLDGKDDGTGLTDKQFEISGTIQKMPSDSLGFYKEYLEWNTMSAEEQATFLPYYIVAGKVGGFDSTDLTMFGVIGGITLFFGLVFLIKYLTGSYQKSVKKYLATCPNKDMASERIDYFVKNTEPYCGVRMNSEFICARNGAATVFGALDKLVWAYEHVTTHRRNFVVTGRTYQLVLGFIDGKKQYVSISSEQQALDLMKMIADRCPHVILGYTDELQSKYSKDLNGFLQLQYQPVMTQNSSGQAAGSESYQQ